MHTTILGVIALLAAVVCLVMRKPLVSLGLLLMAVALGFSFLAAIKTLPVDAIGIGLTLLFAAGCATIIYSAALKR